MKAFLPVLVSVLILISTVLWIVFAGFSFSGNEIPQVIAIIVLAGFGLVIGVRRWKSLSRRQPPEDEMSARMTQKSAALSYYISLYMWLVIMYLTSEKKLDSEVSFGTGIICMGILFLLTRIYFHFFGLKHG